MRLKILGCSGGIGGSRRTTAFLLDQDILIDGGTGLIDLTLEEMTRIDHIFITHSHLDHTGCIPLLIDSVARHRHTPIHIYAIEPVLHILKQHMFNWLLWPDFGCIPTEEYPAVIYENLTIDEATDLDGRRITPIPANHVVPAVGYQLESQTSTLIFTGDTTCNDALWERINNIDNIAHLIIETAFPEEWRDMALLSKHLSPSLLARELINLKCNPTVYLTHLKPGDEQKIVDEVRLYTRNHTINVLYNGQTIIF